MAGATFVPHSILVTGGAGYIGSHFVDSALQIWPSAHIVVLDILDQTVASEKNLAAAIGTGRCRLVRGNIQSMDLLRYLMRQYAFDLVCHFCAQTHVDLSFGNSMQFTMTNVVGTHCLLETMREYNIERKQQGTAGIQRIIVVGTDEVNGSTDIAVNEDVRFKPSNPYAASKAGAECLAMSYLHSYQLPIIQTHGNNVFGGGRQSKDKLWPKMICQRLCDPPLPLSIHGNGLQRRSFLHVKDVAQAFITIIQKGQVGETYNIGTDVEHTVLDVARVVLNATGVTSVAEQDRNMKFVADRPFQDASYRINSNKLMSLGWQPTRTVDETVREMVAWYDTFGHDWWPVDTDSLLSAHPPRVSLA